MQTLSHYLRFSRSISGHLRKRRVHHNELRRHPSQNATKYFEGEQLQNISSRFKRQNGMRRQTFPKKNRTLADGIGYMGILLSAVHQRTTLCLVDDPLDASVWFYFRTRPKT